MTDDPIIEEIHRVRESISAKFNDDLQSIADDASRRQLDSGRKTVSLPPRRPPSAPPIDAPTRAKAG
jgi:hypothetical protein